MSSLPHPIRLATRRSPLALAQAEMVRQALLRTDPALAPDDVILLPMTTTGDQTQQKNLPEWGYKGLFTKEIEDALLEGHAEIAVHSMKDMPSVLPDGLVIAGMLEREDPRDAFISLHYASVDELPPASRIGSSSVRRAAMLKRLRPDCEIVAFRGNVGTRLEKLQQGHATATILAVAGLKRLGLTQHITAIMSLDHMIPAVAQGAIGIECRTDNPAIRDRIAAISHHPTMTTVTAERAVLQILDGSCKTPLGAHAVLSGNTLHLHACLLRPDGSKYWEEMAEGPVADGEKMGREVGEALRFRAQQSGWTF